VPDNNKPLSTIFKKTCLTEHFLVLLYVYSILVTGKNRQRLYLAGSMDDKHTGIEISDRATPKNKPEEHDVMEAPERWVWLGSQEELRFGTAGE
jgi:hypothetical protein